MTFCSRSSTDSSRKRYFLHLVPEDTAHDLEVFCDPTVRPRLSDRTELNWLLGQQQWTSKTATFPRTNVVDISPAQYWQLWSRPGLLALEGRSVAEITAPVFLYCLSALKSGKHWWAPKYYLIWITGPSKPVKINAFFSKVLIHSLPTESLIRRNTLCLCVCTHVSH